MKNIKEEKMPIACKNCIAERGLKGSEIKNLFQTDKELFDHMEAVHHTLVIREHETKEQSIERFLREHPEAKTCPQCIEAGAPWTKG